MLQLVCPYLCFNGNFFVPTKLIYIIKHDHLNTKGGNIYDNTNTWYETAMELSVCVQLY